MTSRIPIGQRLLKAGYIDAWQLQSALAHQRSWGGRIGESLVKLGFVNEHALLTEVGRQLGVPYVVIGDRQVAPSVVQIVPEKLILAHRLFPIAYAPQPRRGLLVVATSKPQDLVAIDEVAFATGKIVKPALASERDVERAIERYLGARNAPMSRAAGARGRAPGAIRAA